MTKTTSFYIGSVGSKMDTQGTISRLVISPITAISRMTF